MTRRVKTIDLLSPLPHDSYAPGAAESARPFLTAFSQAGIKPRLLPWNSAEAGSRPAVALFAWGYHHDHRRWLDMLDVWPGNVPLFNTPGLLRWNSRKTYLAEMEAAGVPIVPTIFADANDESIAAAFDQFQSPELIVKPQVSAGSHETYRLKRGDPYPQLAEAMIQPFLPSIADEGEYSLFYIGGAFTHAIRKQAVGGEFRIQPQFGGRNSRWSPDGEATDVAEASLRAAPEPATYARIDLLRSTDGRLALMEFEATEPDLYPDFGDRIAERLVETIASSL